MQTDTFAHSNIILWTLTKEDYLNVRVRLL